MRVLEIFKEITAISHCSGNTDNIFIFAFLPMTFLIYFLLNGKKLVLAAKGWLFFASLIFYSYWNISYLTLLLGSI